MGFFLFVDSVQKKVESQQISSLTYDNALL